jgi:hypothetical protein
MASFQQHCGDCERFLGDRCEDVNIWIDEYFKTHGPSHRRFRHHREGMWEATALFGERGKQAAAIHILRDCRNIPTRGDYESGRVDPLGLLKNWPVSAYVRYEEQDFTALVMNTIVGAQGTVLWAFINPESALTQFLSGISRYSLPEIQQLLPKHREAVQAASNLALSDTPVLHDRSADAKTLAYFESLSNSAVMAQVKQTYAVSEFAYVRVKDLITPLVYIDQEYIEELRPELASLDEVDVAKFAIPDATNIRVRSMIDPTNRSVNFISNNKSLSIGPAQITSQSGGVLVSFFVGATTAVVTVIKHENRLILRNGIHRAYLLAKLGLQEIPCVLTAEQAPNSLMISSYPAFVPAVLMQKRPPMLIDFFDPRLSIDVPLQRNHKVVKISAEETVLPVD